jgi:tRNA(adenine34) deaminase
MCSENQKKDLFQENDNRFMDEALREAKKAFSKGETPVGAIIVFENRIIGRAHNQVELLQDATAHAEMIALTQASSALQNWRLSGAQLYVTKEPCPMCFGAITLSRIERLVYGASEKRGPSVNQLANMIGLKKSIPVLGGVKEEECKEILQSFFRIQREKTE